MKGKIFFHLCQIIQDSKLLFLCNWKKKKFVESDVPKYAWNVLLFMWEISSFPSVFQNLNAFCVPLLTVLALWKQDQKASGIKGNRTKIKNTKERWTGGRPEEIIKERENKGDDRCKADM